MSDTKSDTRYTAFIKSTLKEHGFQCRGNLCKPKSKCDLTVQIDFRNRWGRPLDDVGLLVKDSEVGWLMTGDLDHLFTDFMALLQKFDGEELRDLRSDVDKRIRAVFAEQIIPQALAWTQYEHFLAEVDAGRFAGNGIFIPAIDKLKAKINWQDTASKQ